MNAGYNSIAVIQCQSNRITRKVNRGNKRRRYAGDLRDAFARRGRSPSPISVLHIKIQSERPMQGRDAYRTHDAKSVLWARTAAVCQTKQAEYTGSACRTFSHPDCHRRLWILTRIHLWHTVFWFSVQGRGLGMSLHASPPVGNSTLPRRSVLTIFEFSIAGFLKNSTQVVAVTLPETSTAA